MSFSLSSYEESFKVLRKEKSAQLEAPKGTIYYPRIISCPEKNTTENEMKKPDLAGSGSTDGTVESETFTIPSYDFSCKRDGMNSGFYFVSRELSRAPFVLSLPPAYRCVLQTILDYMTYAPCEVYDHSEKISLEIGEFMCTERQLAELANVTRNDVQRALAKFRTFKIVSQRVSHRKTIITVSREYIFQIGDPNEEPKKSQKRAIKEKDNKSSSKEEDRNCRLACQLSRKENVFFNFDTSKFEGLGESDIAAWQKLYPACDINREILAMEEWCLSNETKARSKKLWRRFITGWLGRANERQINKKAFSDSYGKDRRTKNKDGSAVESPYEGLF